MKPDLAVLRQLAEALPAGAAVPVPREWLLELLGAAEGATVIAVDLTVRQVADRFGRRPSTVRSWCESGQLPGAYRNRGREWRVPPTALQAFQERQRPAVGLQTSAQTSARRRSLADWRSAS